MVVWNSMLMKLVSFSWVSGSNMFVSYYNNLFFNGSMELHVAENQYHTLGCCVATCSFHRNIICHDSSYFLLKIPFSLISLEELPIKTSNSPGSVTHLFRF